MRTSLAHSNAVAALVALVASFAAAACSDTPAPVAPRPAVSLAKGPTPNGPNALPQRGRIVFQMPGATTINYDIYSINEDGTGLLRLTYNPSVDFLPAGSPDGKKIAYVAAREGGVADILVMNADGSLPKTIAKLGLSVSNYSRMEWSPDGKKIATALRSPGGVDEWDIYLVNVVTGTLTQVTSLPGEEKFPSWSPDGSRLAFHMNDGGGFKQVFTMKPDGSDITQFTFCPADCMEPSWSPDGATIAIYHASAQTTYTTWVSDPTIAAGFVTGRYAVWSPDAARLVFQKPVFGLPSDLATASFAGADLKPLASASLGLSFATWLRK